jgi:hypothetical protein
MRPYLITAKLMRPSNMKRFPTPDLDYIRVYTAYMLNVVSSLCFFLYGVRVYLLYLLPMQRTYKFHRFIYLMLNSNGKKSTQISYLGIVYQSS